MNKNYFIVLLLCIISNISIAGVKKNSNKAISAFSINNVTDQYNIRLESIYNLKKNKELDGNCDNSGLVYIALKNKTKEFQSIRLANICINTKSIAFNQKINKSVADVNSSIIVGDFNFDGHDDLAIWTGDFAGYGGASYDVYLFDKKMQKLIYNKCFSDLSINSTSMFYLDLKKRLVVSQNKDGCCSHSTYKFRVKNNHLFVVEEVDEDLIDGTDLIKITTKKLINGKWVIKVKKIKQVN